MIKRDVRLGKGCSLSIDTEGDVIALTQRFKECSCKTKGQGEVFICILVPNAKMCIISANEKSNLV